MDVALQQLCLMGLGGHTPMHRRKPSRHFCLFARDCSNESHTTSAAAPMSCPDPGCAAMVAMRAHDRPNKRVFN